MDLDNLLNASQLDAVKHTDGASVIVAGAGSGKTRVLIYKIAHHIELGVMPSNILALTFTNKAAREMRERIMQVVGPKAAHAIWMGTFHSVFARILRTEAETIGFTPQFTIYDTADSKSLVKSIVKELALDEKSYKPAAVQSRISSAKNQMITPSIYAKNSALQKDDVKCNMPRFSEIFAIYCLRCREANAMDFDDLLVYTASLFNQCPDVLRRYQERFKYVLVDEYQDTNVVQHNIVMQLAALNGNICVVGDDAQSIYSFRGAKIDNILSFKEHFDSCAVFKLEQNYRSTKNIVNAANSLIDKNRRQIRKHLFSERSVGDKIDVIGTISDTEEAYVVSRNINKLLKSKCASPEDVAVLYRTNAQSRVFEEALRKLSLPYKIYGGLSFYQRKEIKDIVAYLRLVVNPADVEALRRIVNFPARGIGATTLAEVYAAANRNPQVPILNLIENISQYETSLKAAPIAKLAKFANLINSFVEKNATYDAYKMAEYVVFESGIMADAMTDTSVENLSRKENIQEFLNAVHEFCDEKVNRGDNEIQLTNFLSEVSLITDQDDSKEEHRPAITLMTVHAAKGLEFPHVYIVGMEENLFPSMMVDSEMALEEERRLFYVAITRAKERCSISYAKSRFRYGQTHFSNPSRFICDVDSKYLNFSDGCNPNKIQNFVSPYDIIEQRRFESKSTESFNNAKPVANLRRIKPSERNSNNVTTRSSNNSITQFVAGDEVVHSTFGNGVVIDIVGEDDNLKASVQFENFGVKQLLLKYARLTKI